MLIRLRYSIACSFAIHLIAIGSIWWGASLFVPSDGGGRGSPDVVSVWLSGGDGRSFGEGAKRPAPRAKTPSIAAQRTPASPPSESPAGPPAAGSGDGVGGGSGSGIGGGSGGDPRLAEIWKKIDRAKYYPEIARHQGIEGSPRVTFSIREDGSIAGVDLASSCGQAILDEAAKEAVRRAAPLPYYPAPITLAVRYALTK